MRWSWLIGALFAVGSLCFVIAPFPGFVELIGPASDGAVFFVGSIFFTSAAALQYRVTLASAVRGSGDRWAALVQLLGTLFFNLSTYRAWQAALDAPAGQHPVWRPDLLGSACFLVASWLAYAGVRAGARGRGWAIAALNLLGSVAFGVSAVASHIVPATGAELAAGAANATTAVGALCFLAGALLLMRTGHPAAGAAHRIEPHPGRCDDAPRPRQARL